MLLLDASARPANATSLPGTEMLQGSSTLMPLAEKLQRESSLSSSDLEAVLALPHTIRRLGSGQHLVREGDEVGQCNLLLSGCAARQRFTADGRRQILAFHIRGDFVDLQNALLGRAHDDVQLLSPAEVAVVPKEAIVDLAFARPAIGTALWTDTLIDASIAREWIVNVGQRDARTRVLHLLCELHERHAQAGLADDATFELTLSQEQLADATGLTSVHVNRMLQAVKADGLFEQEKRTVRVKDQKIMQAEGDFSADYLRAG